MIQFKKRWLLRHYEKILKKNDVVLVFQRTNFVNRGLVVKNSLMQKAISNVYLYGDRDFEEKVQKLFVGPTLILFCQEKHFNFIRERRNKDLLGVLYSGIVLLPKEVEMLLQYSSVAMLHLEMLVTMRKIIQSSFRMLFQTKIMLVFLLSYLILKRKNDNN